MHIHVFMLRRMFELIPIKIGFNYEFLKLLEDRANDPVLGTLAKFCQKWVGENSDRHTCPYVA